MNRAAPAGTISFVTTRTLTRPRWRVPAALIALSFVPVLAGAFRLTELTGGARVTPDNARFFAAPAPLVVHIVASMVFCVVGAFQFMPGPRRQRHRVAGRLVVLCGLAAALSGVWMTLTYPHAPGDGELLAVFRLVFGTGMAVAITFAFAAIRKRNVALHRAWMTRAYAIGAGAGTQAVLLGGWIAFAGAPGEVARALLLAGGWVLNLAVAETLLLTRRSR
jgi:uncharacterized membrane protein